MSHLLFFLSFLIPSGKSEDIGRIFQENCNEKNYLDCFQLAQLYMQGGLAPSGQKSQNLISKGISISQKSCAKRDIQACESLRDLYYDDIFIPRDLSNMLIYAQKSCDLDSIDSCIFLGEVFTHKYLDETSSIPKDEKKGKEYYQKAFSLALQECSQKEYTSCALVGRMYDNYEGISPDAEKVKQYYKTAYEGYQQRCDNAHTKDCFFLGQLYMSGKGVSKDPKKAIALWDKACSLGDDEVCFNMGLHYEYDNPSLVLSQQYFRKSFERTEWNVKNHKTKSNIRDLGYMLLEGKGVTLDIKRGIELHEQACAMNDPDACIELGAYYQTGINIQKNPQKAKELLHVACLGGITQACTP